MAFRQTLNKPVVAIVLVVVVAVIAVAIYLFTSSSSAGSTLMADYTTDDGSTYFSAPAQAAPFTYNGKPAYQAGLYRCGTGKTFVGYLVRYEANAQAAVNNAYRHRMQLPTAGMSIKRPGDAEWTAVDPALAASPQAAAENLAAAQQIRLVKCPDGNYATQLLSN
jgi:hypothetical protein